MIYIDIAGLARNHRGGALAAALGLVGEPVEEADRLALLARLQHGAGVTILTGPEGAPFWLLASKEVEVRVLPDNYVFKERVSDKDEWSFRAAGLAATEARRVLRRKSPPRAAHRLYPYWVEGRRLASLLPPDVRAEVVLDWDYRRLPAGDLYTFLRDYSSPLALDWEWDITTKVPFDLGAYDGTSTTYVPVDDWNRGEILAAVGDRLRAGRPTIFHGGRADLGTQHDRDPEELIDTPPHDSQIMAYLCGEPNLHLKHLARQRLKRQVVDYAGDLRALPEGHRARYVCADARNSYDLFQLYSRRLAETGQQGVYEQIERPLMPLIASMERGGVPVDMAALQAMREESVIVEQALERWFADAQDCQVQDDESTLRWLTKLLGHNPGTLDQRVISWYPNPDIDLLLFYRRTRTTRRNFFDKCIKLWETAGRPSDFRVYPSFNQAGDPEEGRPAPRSGRLSSSGELNIQQQPGTVKPIYVAPAGHLWWDYDYKGIELRVAAAVSGDATMSRALREGIDLHTLLAERTAALTGTRPERVVAKRWNFGKLYGAQLDKLLDILASARVFIDRPTAAAMDRAHADLFPDYPQWAQNVVRKTKRDGYSVTWYGRRRYIPEINSDDPKETAHAANAAINHVVQGTSGDLLKLAMVRSALAARLYRAHVATSVHDAIGGWVPEELASRWDRTAHTVLTSLRVSASMPMEVEGHYGRSWADCH